MERPIINERGGILNNLNFDNDEEFGFKVTAYNLVKHYCEGEFYFTFGLYGQTI